MKNEFRVMSRCVILILFSTFACKKQSTLPILSTNSVSNITASTSISGGNIISDGGAPIVARGICWNTNSNPTISDNKTTDGNGIGSFSSNMTDLNFSTLYYVRAYATNKAGTQYGEELSFRTVAAVDIDGNVYHSVKIGTQIWLVENLNVKRYRNGDPIPYVTSNDAWYLRSTDACGDYDNLASNGLIYGKLYNGYAVTDIRNIAPLGWHVSTYSEWNILVNFNGGTIDAGAKLREAGSSHWQYSSTSTNSSGFTALPAGSRRWSGDFDGITKYGLWWTTTNDLGYLWTSYLTVYNQIYLTHGSGKTEGYSVRCVKD